MEQGLYKQSNLRHSKHLLKGTGLKRHAKIYLSIYQVPCRLVVKFKLKCTSEICWWGKAVISKSISKHPWVLIRRLEKEQGRDFYLLKPRSLILQVVDNSSTGLEQLFLFSGISLPRRNPTLGSYRITCQKSPCLPSTLQLRFQSCTKACRLPFHPYCCGFDFFPN